ncbi:hypothetical protein [Rhizobium leguminosarum]|uniref:hypothetical protein n=1 Tax=Rhizobium leguminosarum TaxID=384 RepID=UPI001C951A13|nr:hypothetical protein [Rhizobium leguminosarum]MBY5440575.1 hypothetical protein [Rhizobium leguminosarum]
MALLVDKARIQGARFQPDSIGRRQALIPPRTYCRPIFSKHSPVNRWQCFLLSGGADRFGRWKNTEGTSIMTGRWNDKDGTA